MAAQVTGIMVGHFFRVFSCELKPSIIYKLKQVLGHMNNLKIHHKFGIFIFKGVKAMGGRNNDFLNAIIDKGFDIFPG